MAGEPNNTIGKCACPFCREDMPVRNNGRGTLNVSCPWCGVSAYAKPGTQAHGIVSGWVKMDITAAPVPAAAEPEKRGLFGRT